MKPKLKNCRRIINLSVYKHSFLYLTRIISLFLLLNDPKEIMVLFFKFISNDDSIELNKE